jgi:hypothetical protein
MCFDLDFDGDGCADIVGQSTDGTIDPADFYPLTPHATFVKERR